MNPLGLAVPFPAWLVLTLATILGLLPATGHAANSEFHLVYIGEKSHSAYLGLAQGLEEANLQGQFLGQAFILHQHTTTDFAEAATPETLAIFTAADTETLTKLSQQFPQLPIFNLALDEDALRSLCRPNLFHIPPSRRMKQDASAQWRKLQPKSRAIAQAWHPAYEKFSANQLNNRFRKTHGQAMDDFAWAGWAAIKLTTDTLARQPGLSRAALLEYLSNQLAFDGQKGIEMNFRPDGQLRQPLLLIEAGKIVGEAPVKGVADVSDLVSLGKSECPVPSTHQQE
jgi:hypothetical protein